MIPIAKLGHEAALLILPDLTTFQSLVLNITETYDLWVSREDAWKTKLPYPTLPEHHGKMPD